MRKTKQMWMRTAMLASHKRRGADMSVRGHASRSDVMRRGSLYWEKWRRRGLLKQILKGVEA